MSKHKLQAARDLRAANQLAEQNTVLVDKVTEATAKVNALTKSFDWGALDKINLPVELQLELEQLAEAMPEIPTPKKRRTMSRI